jgi:hypothetical protein
VSEQKDSSAQCGAASAELTPEQLEAAAQALADDVWHPPIPLAKMVKHEANKFRRQALPFALRQRPAASIARPHPQGPSSQTT